MRTRATTPPMALPIATAVVFESVDEKVLDSEGDGDGVAESREDEVEGCVVLVDAVIVV
ncbi:hypothetical protein BJY04DRAFT_198214 [Aspergillus karnatakaensis]|uniref:uncharacterized protein n=1 Tax=Aspergillus karnatakaensis TaxID=1810916 RepID=UPI003CCE4326